MKEKEKDMTTNWHCKERKTKKVHRYLCRHSFSDCLAKLSLICNGIEYFSVCSYFKLLDSPQQHCKLTSKEETKGYPIFQNQRSQETNYVITILLLICSIKSAERAAPNSNIRKEQGAVYGNVLLKWNWIKGMHSQVK